MKSIEVISDNGMKEGNKSMQNRKSIIIILLIIILALGTLAFYFSRLYTSVNKEN